MMLGICPDATTNAEFVRIEGIVGQRMGVRRCYSFGGTVPSSLASSPAAVDVGLRTSWLSISNMNATNVAAGNYDSQFAAFATSVGNHPMMLTWNHEPENDGYSPATFKAGFERFYDVVKTANPAIQVGVIWMAWMFDPTNTGTADVDQWSPAANKMDFGGIDHYNTYNFPPGHTEYPWLSIPDSRLTGYFNWVDSVSASRGSAFPTAIGELGCANWLGNVSGHPPDDGTSSPVGTRKSQWIDGILHYFEDRDCIAVCYFETDVNNDYSPSSFIEADQPTIDVWASWLATHQTGVQ
jgi:hypothetical protein